MIEREGERLWVTVPMVMGNASALVAAGEKLFSASDVVDLAKVQEADSSALAVLLAWLRFAGLRRIQLTFANLPTGVSALADLYGVASLLPRA